MSPAQRNNCSNNDPPAPSLCLALDHVQQDENDENHDNRYDSAAYVHHIPPF
jgi:hypothetical protein